MFGEIDQFNGYHKYALSEFELESGDILHDVQVEYSLLGTPNYDEDGNITNLIIPFHKFNGNHASIGNIYELTQDGGPFDLNEYCFISITSFGFPESCSPSTTRLKHKFPKYTIKDKVNFKRQFLKEKFNVDHVHGLIGQGLGGYDIYTWASEYPDEMDFIVIMNSSFKHYGYRYVVSKVMDSIIESSDDFYNDVYSDSLSRMLVSIIKLVYSNFFSKKIFHDMSNDEIDVLMEDFVDQGLFLDVYDLKSCDDAVMEFDVEDNLGNIKAKTLIFSYVGDLYFSPEFDAIPLKTLIDDSKIIMINSPDDTTGYDNYGDLTDDLNEFLEQFKNKEDS